MDFLYKNNSFEERKFYFLRQLLQSPLSYDFILILRTNYTNLLEIKSAIALITKILRMESIKYKAIQKSIYRFRIKRSKA